MNDNRTFVQSPLVHSTQKNKLSIKLYRQERKIADSNLRSLLATN